MMTDSSYDTIISGGQAFINGQLRPRTVAVKNGILTDFFEPGTNCNAKKQIDATGLVLLPGLIDPHVHFREPGPTYKEGVSTGSMAAAAGGYTLVGDMPNCSPATIGAGAIEQKAAIAERTSFVDLAIWAGARDADDVWAAQEAGAVGIKLFLHGAVGLKPGEATPGDGWDPKTTSFHPDLVVASTDQLLEICSTAANARLPVVVHLGDQALWNRSRQGWAGRSFASVLHELRSESSVDKRVSAATTIETLIDTGVWLHVAHVPGPVVPLVVAARQRGFDITMESFLPFMRFDDAAEIGVLGFNRYKTAEETAALWGWISDETIDIVATDHAPHLLEEKRQGDADILNCPSGYPELDTAVPMMLDQVAKGTITLKRMAEVMSENPARLLGVSATKGRLKEGYHADIAFVDLDVAWQIGTRQLYTRPNWSPYMGQEVQGRVEMTMVRGEIVFDRGTMVGDPSHGSVVNRVSAKVT